MQDGGNAAYVCFGEALGFMDLGGMVELMDVHGAGAQRSDPKIGVGRLRKVAACSVAGPHGYGLRKNS